MTEQHSTSRTQTRPLRPPSVPPSPASRTEFAQAAPPEPAGTDAFLVLLIDSSGSMADDGKGAALDHAVTALAERLERSETRCWHAAAVVFGPGDRAHVHRDLRPVASWLRLPAPTPSGRTPLGSALAVAAEIVSACEAQQVSIVLFTDGFPTDEWRLGLDDLEAAAPHARRLAVAVRADADISVLKAFASAPVEHHLLRTDEVTDIPSLVDSLADWLPPRLERHGRAAQRQRDYVAFSLAERT